MIDDNVNLVGMVEDYFEDNSRIEVVGKAYDGEEGLEIIREGQLKYDLIILDLIMPKKDGMGVLKELKKEDRHENIIVYVLSNILKVNVLFSSETRGKELSKMANDLKEGEVLLIENTRFEDIDGDKESKCNKI